MFLGLAFATALPASAQQGQGGSGGSSGSGTSETTGTGGASGGGGTGGTPNLGDHPNHPNHSNRSGPEPSVVIAAIQKALQGKAVKSGPSIVLGVGVSPAPPELSHLMPDQASLAPQTGLLVNHIEKDSPADKAGLQEGDVLAKLDDQILMLPEQLAILVSGKKEGESIKLTYLRNGESKEAAATLITRNSPAGSGDIQIFDGNGGGGSFLTITRTFDPTGGPDPVVILKSVLGDDATPAPEASPGTPKPETAEVLERLQKIEAMLIELKNSIKQ